MTDLQKLAGASGMVIQESGAGAVTGLTVEYFIARETSTITVCTGLDADGNAVDFKVTQNWDSLIAGDECIPPTGSIIQAITLTVGSIKRF